MAGHLEGPVLADVDDDDPLVLTDTMGTDPHRRTEQLVRDRVLTRFEHHHRRVRRHHPGGPERDRVRVCWHRVQPAALLGQHLVRWPTGDPVWPGVDLLTERRARRLELSEAGVLLTQVRVLGDDVSLADLHRRLGAALGRRIRRHTGVHHHRVVLGERHQLRIPDRDPGDVLDRDGLLVVGQHIGRHPTQPPERHVQGREHRGHRLVTDREHHPEPRPGQPRHEQHRLHTVDDRPVAVVVLQPHPRLGDPGPVHPHMPCPIGLLDLRDRTAGRPLRTGVPQREQLLVGHIGTNLALGPFDPLLDLGQILID